MSQKKELFGLSLLDVLSNALLGGIVLMIIAAVSVSVTNMQIDFDRDIEVGESEFKTDPIFIPVQKIIKSDSMIVSCFFQTFGGNNSSFQLKVSQQKLSPNCYDIKRGYYESDYWFIARTCEIKDDAVWSIIIEGNQENLPDSIFLHVNAGLRPVKLEDDLRTLKKSRFIKNNLSYNNYKLVTIEEGIEPLPSVY